LEILVGVSTSRYRMPSLLTESGYDSLTQAATDALAGPPERLWSWSATTGAGVLGISLIGRGLNVKGTVGQELI
jgi:hypothetical protein